MSQCSVSACNVENPVFFSHVLQRGTFFIKRSQKLKITFSIRRFLGPGTQRKQVSQNAKGTQLAGHTVHVVLSPEVRLNASGAFDEPSFGLKVDGVAVVANAKKRTNRSGHICHLTGLSPLVHQSW